MRVPREGKEKREGDNENRSEEARGWNFRKALPWLGEFPRDTETYLSQFLREPIKPRLDSPRLPFATAKIFHG